jgi:hypothetical protein
MFEYVDKGKEASNPLSPLHIEKNVGETMTCIPKGESKKDSHNPNARDSYNYSIVENLAQTPCAMFALEFLQSFTSQRKSLFSTLRATETANSGIIFFNLTNYKPSFPHHIALQIVLVYAMKTLTRNIFCMVVDEGALTCIMLLAC